jgi:two-component system, chemotaxis family, CheB/CheR fusion protein
MQAELQNLTVVENATDYAIFSMDLQRRVTIWNSGAQRLLGFTGDEVMGQSADVIFTPEDRAAGVPDKETAVALREGRASDDRFHQRKDGSRFWSSGALMLMRNVQGEAVGFVKILRDQTAVRETQQALERSQAELQAADAAKDRFLAVLSHELRNPLASIDSAAELLLTPQLAPSERDAAAHVVKRQAGTMKALLDELLDVSRLKLGRLQLHPQRITVASVVEAALETVRPSLVAAGHKLSVDLPDHDIELDADRLRIGQVIANLLSNAIKYTPAGGQIRLEAKLAGNRATIVIADNGIGIEADQIGHMFEMYAQAQQGCDASHGLGIGLALAKSIVEMHGGSIEAFSPGPGKGTEFRVTLPAHASRKKRGLILIADDNVDAGWAIARLLEIAGFSTMHVRGGAEAVREANHRRPDAAILDIGMPDLSGLEVARQIRQNEWGKPMVLIAATGWGQESDERAAIEAGFDAHMTKPVDLRKLSATVDELLLKKRRG